MGIFLLQILSLKVLVAHLIPQRSQRWADREQDQAFLQTYINNVLKHFGQQVLLFFDIFLWDFPAWPKFMDLVDQQRSVVRLLWIGFAAAQCVFCTMHNHNSEGLHSNFNSRIPHCVASLQHVDSCHYISSSRDWLIYSFLEGGQPRTFTRRTPLLPQRSFELNKTDVSVWGYPMKQHHPNALIVQITDLCLSQIFIEAGVHGLSACSA